MLCLQSVYHNTVRHLPAAPTWLNASNPKHLQEAEILSQNISLYAWLSYKFSQIFIDSAAVKAMRIDVSMYIQTALLTQAGYGQTARETDYLQLNKHQ